MFDRSVWQRTRRGLVPALGVLAAMVLAIGVFRGFPCTWLGLVHGIWVPHCPTGELRLDVNAEAYGLVRGTDQGRLVVSPAARWVVGHDRRATSFRRALPRGVAISAELIDAEGAAVAGIDRSAFRGDRDSRTAELVLPDLPDGDYLLRVEADAGFETRSLDLEVPLYTPSLLHVMTDRPLYRPGQTVQFRAAVLARTDRQPLEDRPGRWTVTSPSGYEMLSERAETGPWGIVAGSFPLDDAAEIGRWSVVWSTGDDDVTATFDVRRFALPRLGIEAAPTAPWAGPGDRLRFEGRATYTSGGPVASGAVEARLKVTEGRWPLPIVWEGPRVARTDSDGRFTVDFGRVPADLMDRTTLALLVQVTESAGETATTTATSVLSPESLRLDAVTELGDGVIGGFNNRVYIRVAAPDGRPHPGAEVEVRPPGAPDAVRTAVADESGVIAIQLDPGEPITVVEKAPPVRSRPLKANPVRLRAASRAGGEAIELPTRRALDALHPRVARCGLYTVGDREVAVGIRVGEDGRPDDIVAPRDRLGRCVAIVMRSLSLPEGPIRTYALTWRVPDSQHPSLVLANEHTFGAGVDALLQDAALRARRCLPFGRGRDGAAIARVHWSVEVGSRDLEVEVEPLDRGELAGWSWRCVRDTFLDRDLDERADEAAMGATTVHLRVPSTVDGPPPQDRTLTAYAFEITARDPDSQSLLGRGRLVVPVGELPDLRLRATPALVAPGDEVTVELLRGPGFVGGLPARLTLMRGSVEVADEPVEDNEARFTVPKDVAGFLSVAYLDARAVVFVRPEDPLTVHVSSDDPSYRPGDTATLTVSTRAGGRPQPTAVGLSGVDATLAALAELPSPSDLGRATVRAQATTPAFGRFDPVALALGQVEGQNAALATVLRVGTLPADPAGHRAVRASASGLADVDSPLTLGFYRVLEKAVELVRAWEASAPEDQMLTAERMVGIWARALDEVEAAGEPAVDGFGRPLTLAVLPEELLDQVDPRQMASDGTRLPEDVVNWFAYVDTHGRAP